MTKVLFILITTVLMAFSVQLWKEYNKDFGVDGSMFLFFTTMTFIVSPLVGYLFSIFVHLLFYLLGFWLLPIVLLMTLVTTYVYWDNIKEYVQDKGECE